MTDRRLTMRFAAVLATGALVAGCGTSSPTKVDYKSDSKSKEASLAVPPNMLDETADQRSLPPQGGATSLSALQQVQQAAPATDTVAPAVADMRIQRDGTESWLVIDGKKPADVWPQVRRFWQEQGFLLVVDQRDKGVMETDWNETRPQINDGLIRSVISKAMGNSYVTAERNKYRTRLDVAPNGGTYVFISQKGMREALTGANNDSSKWEPKPNDPGLETEYLKRLMAVLAQNEQRAKNGEPPIANIKDEAVPKDKKDADASSKAAAAIAAQNVSRTSSQGGDAGAATVPSEVTLGEPYDRSWLHVGLALDRANFTVDDRDRTQGLYFVRYVDPKDLSAAQQGFWSQLFHGKKEKQAKQYRVNVKALTPDETRVAVVDESGAIDTSSPARQIMSLLVNQLR
ncbi:outer membrane protein assembly factor BamC [Burkholderia multivorans]|uniref:outer membrane protein assembly factor BamC n=1 Tax=Burkholderia multivorans TaxID=87883 RepID=UPI000CFF4FF1|nr:outer membrane protein assembly factor BamC [Burkholderia multivorans]MBR7894114.1 outer membrane protein assembly factor BamC [Burkholderia multivorans]MBR8452023.1 outer membrane protein assembly factor BamC [Burkholderia multivorans]MBU9446950.1 outer membrane protein assembly factor BamC [Burkholderia multivorans]MCL4646911.1 outer membrane protein assembly factor BamC [Burkholderia multivorans]PRG43336.1 NlpB/DapX lipoprotein domain protein [Burkholderia multivorans]